MILLPDELDDLEILWFPVNFTEDGLKAIGSPRQILFSKWKDRVFV